jgi:5-methylcytosine-specific restriction endonuclease McrA
MSLNSGSSQTKTLPIQRQQPTRRRVIYKPDLKYTSYKGFLQNDFNYRCGYCDSFDGIIRSPYHIDHFVPRKVFEKQADYQHLENTYDNLIYACPSCNLSKSGKWPTGDPAVTHSNNMGFIDPCDPVYHTHLYRSEKGDIKYHTLLGKFLVKNLNLHLRRHKVSWTIERMIDNLDALDQEIMKTQNVLIMKKYIKISQSFKVYIKEHFNWELRV